MIRPLNKQTPQIHPSAFISEQAYIVGRVHIGEYSSIWPGTVVRGDSARIKIGSYVNIQDNSLVHTDNDSTYGDYITIGHGVVCHAKTVANYVLIGNGAVINDGAELGEFSIIAAGAVVLENVTIPPCSLVVGVPAIVKGPTKERHMERIKQTAKEYAQKAQLYLKSGLGDKLV